MKKETTKPLKPTFPESKIEHWNGGITIKGLILALLVIPFIVALIYLIQIA